jgi:uracil-DNA glycosylase family 4
MGPCKPNTAMRLACGTTTGKALSEMTRGEDTADAPVGRDYGQWLKHESAPVELRMRDRKPPRAPKTAAPQDDVEIEHTRPPAFARAPTEFLLDQFDRVQYFRRTQFALDQSHRVGEIASRISVRPIEKDWGGVEHAKFVVKPRYGGLDYLWRTAEAAVRAVRSDGDRVQVRHRQSSVIANRAKQSGSSRIASSRRSRDYGTMLQPADLSPIPESEAPRDCPLCPRLVRFRQECRKEFPGWWNAPVPAFGDRDAWLAIVGLAPGKQGANRTGRPFTGDYAGELLYATLLKFGLAIGEYHADPGDGLQLKGAIILNAVKCLPPANKPEPSEIATCRNYFEAALTSLQRVTVLVALGQIAHVAAARALGLPSTATKFGHGAEAHSADGRILLSSYHCSRYNQNTRRLDAAMFESVFERAVKFNARVEHEGGIRRPA